MTFKVDFKSSAQKGLTGKVISEKKKLQEVHGHAMWLSWEGYFRQKEE